MGGGIKLHSVINLNLVSISVPSSLFKPFKDLEYSFTSSLHTVVIILAVTGEIIYLSIAFGLLQFALETITSVGVGIILLGVAFQNKLKNAIAGISIAINHKININDSIEVENVKGKIIQFGLTKTIIEIEDGSKVMIPNVKFDEEIIKITSNRKQKDSNS